MVIDGRKCKQRDECVAACINTLMDRDDCPHFFDGENDALRAWQLLRSWIRTHGKDLMLFPYDKDPRPLMDCVLNNGYYMLLCNNGHGDHAVICKGSERMFDPSWISAPIEGPLSGGFWIVGVIIDYHP